MLLIFIFLGFFFFSGPKNCHAQIPLFYQLFEAYKPTLFFSKNINSSPIPVPTIPVTPTPSPTDKVLGTSDNLGIGGEGKVYTIAVLGDSMIDTLGPNAPQLETSLKKYFPSKKFYIINYGVGASNIEYALFRLSNNYQYLNNNYPSLISQNPDIIIVESFAYNNFGNTQSGIDKQWLNLGAITSTIKDKLPQTKIILASTIAPNSIVFANGIKDFHFSSLEKIEKASTIKIYLKNLINFANSQHFPVADAYNPSLINNEGMTEFISSTDNLHPSEFGKEFFCDTVAKTIFDNQIIN